jgi:hypothetical protein
MGRALFAIPAFVAASALALVTPADVALIDGDVRQHRFVVIAAAPLHAATLRALRR